MQATQTNTPGGDVELLDRAGDAGRALKKAIAVRVVGQEGVVEHNWDQESALETVCPEQVLRGNACVSKDIGDIEYGTVRRHPSGPALREREFRQRPISASAFV